MNNQHEKQLLKANFLPAGCLQSNPVFINSSRRIYIESKKNAVKTDTIALSKMKETNLISERVCVNRIFCCQQRWGNHDAHKDNVPKVTVVAEPVAEHPDTENQHLLEKY